MHFWCRSGHCRLLPSSDSCLWYYRSHILLDSLSTRYGVAADALLWFASYLSGRTQCVRVGGCFSSSVPVPYGVPQGSVNGEILFILLVSALPDQTATDGVIIDQYSDGTNDQIIFQLHSKTNHSDQRAAIANLSHWFCRTDRWLFDQHVILNLSKCLFFYAVSPHQDHKLAPLPLEMGSGILQPFAEVKHLGVTFDSHLSMSSHFAICVGPFSFTCGVLAKFGTFLILLLLSALLSLLSSLELSMPVLSSLVFLALCSLSCSAW